MKTLFSILITFLLFSCTSNESEYEVVQNPNGQQAVYINNGNESFWMEYAMFNALMNNGGMRNVNNYYTTHHTTIINQQRNYSNYNFIKNNKKGTFTKTNQKNELQRPIDKIRLSRREGNTNNSTPSKSKFSRAKANYSFKSSPKPSSGSKSKYSRSKK